MQDLPSRAPVSRKRRGVVHGAERRLVRRLHGPLPDGLEVDVLEEGVLLHLHEAVPLGAAPEPLFSRNTGYVFWAQFASN